MVVSALVGFSLVAWKMKIILPVCLDVWRELQKKKNRSSTTFQMMPHWLVCVQGLPLGGGFKDFLFSTLPGEMIQFD